MERIVSKIKGMEREAVFFNVNAADPEKRKEVLDKMETQIGNPSEAAKVYVLLHSLAFGTLKPFISNSLEEFITQA